MEFLYEYGLFLAKAVTFVVAALILLGSITAAAGGSRERGQEHLNVRHLNQRYRDMEKTLGEHLKTPRSLGQRLRRLGRKQDDKKPSPPPDPDRSRIFVLRFHGDIRASRVENLREEVSAILTQARKDLDQVVVCLESGGGMVPHYGLAASQLVRLRDAGLHLTVTVDRVAASGGYLMAAVAHRIVAAPFAIVGSIGVVAQLPNLHRWLKRREVDVELLTAGEYKRTLTVLGQNTPEGRAKFQQELDEAHALFKAFLGRYRPQLHLDTVATGEHWYGEQALPLNLVDALSTSDDELMRLSREFDLYEVTYRRKQPLGKRFSGAVDGALDRVMRLLGRT
ncbi:putative inner membrane peptidase [Ectothiorhodospira sp. PHS-1]|uniref:protease SohB n=1 Tax=Ectothiorhodospira sp. PHS-1 TaxID=519989 RepID=UPI00024A88E0|nr:protease SohB [Ectothiorhodospira sp. PHS-1]EHQ51885.1 putative inner membrane peptidase [Ectothiorhodospira sp. PHS-1]